MRDLYRGIGEGIVYSINVRGTDLLTDKWPRLHWNCSNSQFRQHVPTVLNLVPSLSRDKTRPRLTNERVYEEHKVNKEIDE